ncbi:L-type lectin-domain containing receptor kinase IX.1-like [Cryptomeria japonica]|uniref:L-type lectin-domain containing receptor kinase IX.1-like n=1 Tax=Cryptomeria japonica TaxID=3369 RepID=UPI0027DA01A1|nr:L-type lectin-domain containing receptor kinase IX.1-like [Cryptomeria japonica]XP_059072038.1 L-type lectin-domain containing receptor kinase IX.1-like [Cryptomeria japonica]
MAELCHAPSSLLFFSCVAASFFFMSHAGNLSFAFPPTLNFMLETDAYFEGDKVIQLTKNLSYSVGWAAYNKSVPLWDNSSRALANFSTHFQFSIGTGNNSQSAFGDGVAFFLAPLDLEQALNTSGGGFGLFNTTDSSESFSPVFAVEFDTYKNPWDPDDNHVGIDVNGVLSQVNFSPERVGYIYSGPCDENLKNGKLWHAWVDYDGEAKRLQVFILCNPNSASVSKPSIPILSYDIDLRNNLPPNIKVGLSASTGNAIERHTVISWNFSCEYSWGISAAALPNNPSIGNPAHEKNNSNPVKVNLISVFCSVVALCFLMFLGWRWKVRESIRRSDEVEESDTELDEWFSQGPRRFSYAELSAATRNFSEDEKLGQGGFGSVYKGILPGTGEMVAVKRISQGSKQGRKEYVSEVTIISKLRHRNLVQLLGWCHQKGELLLVYEYLPKGSLDKYIYGEEEDTLDWDRRYSIACDIASALVYLHEEWDQRVIHRDVKASNVMLDSNFNAKLGDFGLARVVERDQVVSHTTVVAGTLGYLAPECVITGKTGPEADVYSFGAVTLEIACGRRPFDSTLLEHNCRLVEWVWDLYGQGKLSDAVDGKLRGNCNSEEMDLLMLVGLLCSHPNPMSRPTMREVIKILKSEVELPYVPLDLPVAVYNNQPLRLDVTSSALQSSLLNEMLSSLNASVLSPYTASSGSVILSSTGLQYL